jgi:ribonuclease Z
MLEVHILGSSATIPTKNRKLSCILINFHGDRILFDCGEGAQDKIMSEGLGLMKIKAIFITHWHADHFSGLIGLIQTMGMEKRKEPLQIYGPLRTEEFVEKLLSIGHYSRKFKIIAKDLRHNDVVEFEAKVLRDEGRYCVRAFETKHGIPSLGFVFEERSSLKVNKKKMQALGLKSGPLIGKLKNKEPIEFRGRIIKPEDILEEIPGRKVVYTGDTEYCENTIKFSENADLLIHESTYSKEIKDEEEKERHSSAYEAALVAKKAGVKALLLTHISRRFNKNPEILLKEAREVFRNVSVAYDGMKISLKVHRPEEK